MTPRRDDPGGLLRLPLDKLEAFYESIDPRLVDVIADNLPVGIDDPPAVAIGIAAAVWWWLDEGDPA